MEFKRGQGFVPGVAFKLSRTVTEIVTDILEAHPNSNQIENSQFGLGRKPRVARNGKLRTPLRNGNWAKSTVSQKFDTVQPLG